MKRERRPAALHSLLARQLRRAGLVAERPPEGAQEWQALLALVDRAYREADQLVALVTRSERLVTDELAGSQQALADAQRLAGLGSWTHVPGSGTATISDEMARLLGLDGAERCLPLAALLARVRDDDRPRVQRALQEALTAPLRRSGQVGFCDAGGHRLWGQCRLESRAGPDGRVMRVDGTVLDVTERRDAEERSRELERTDTLTGLANRAHFIQKLHDALDGAPGRPQRLAVIFVDLDGFKDVNEQLGHRVGDELLVTIAQRLRGCLRASDLVARFGSDEFVLLLRGTPSRAEAAKVADKVLQACRVVVNDTLGSSVVTASVGIALHPDGGVTADQLLGNADGAMQAAKQSGRNRVWQFGSEPGPQRADGWMARALRSALADDELELAYQPIVDGETGRVLGVEALSRWHHPARGTIPPPG